MLGNGREAVKHPLAALCPCNRLEVLSRSETSGICTCEGVCMLSRCSLHIKTIKRFCLICCVSCLEPVPPPRFEFPSKARIKESVRHFGLSLSSFGLPLGHSCLNGKLPQFALLLHFAGEPQYSCGDVGYASGCNSHSATNGAQELGIIP